MTEEEELASGKFKHGRSAYQYHKCRGPICVEANRAHAETFRKGKRGKLPKNDDRHGTVNGYINYCCRCDPCKAAGAVKNAADAAARKKVAREALEELGQGVDNAEEV
jgi:hypothetical protein